MGVPGAPKNLHLTVPETWFKIDQKHLDGYACFLYIAVQSHRKIPKGIRDFLLSEKSEYALIFLAG